MAAACLNLSDCDAGICIVSPVAGLRPSRAELRPRLKVPKPGTATLSSRLTASVTTLVSVPMTASTSLGVTPVLSDMAPMSSDLFMNFLLFARAVRQR